MVGRHPSLSCRAEGPQVLLAPVCLLEVALSLVGLSSNPPPSPAHSWAVPSAATPLPLVSILIWSYILMP